MNENFFFILSRIKFLLFSYFPINSKKIIHTVINVIPVVENEDWVTSSSFSQK